MSVRCARNGGMQLVPSDRCAGGGDEVPAARLRKLIARKRTEKDRLERDIAEIRASLAEVFALRDRRLEPLDEEIHEHFGVVLEEPGFSSGVRAEIRELYADLMMAATISPRALPGAADLDDDEEERCPCPFCTAEADDGHEPSRGRAESGAHADDAGRIHVPPRREPGGSGSLRDLYRELASRYHPDKAADEETRVEHERLMREINGAYQAGDLDGLAALSQELGFEIAGDGVLEALAGQYERLKAEVRALRHDRLGELVVETRRCEKRGEPAPLVDMAEDIHRRAEHLELLAGVFRSFRTGETDADEFLVELLGDPDDAELSDDELDFEQMVEALVALVSMERPPARAGRKKTRTAPGRRKRRGRRKR